MTRLAYALFPVHIANGIISGAFVFYVIYDCFHYAMHHVKLAGPMKTQKIYHSACCSSSGLPTAVASIKLTIAVAHTVAHHFKSYELGYGMQLFCV